MNDIKNNLNRTIDLAGIMENERQQELIKNGYLQDFTLYEKFIMNYPKITKILLALGVSFLLLLILTPIAKTNAYEGQEISIRDKIRMERLEICQSAYKEIGINKQFIHEQVPAVRCATYMSLIYSYESNYGKSNKCVTTNNCFGLKGNGYDTPRGFLTFENQTEGRKYFAKKYFQWHYKKDIKTFVYNWSTTDQKVYTEFVKARYWNMYNELESLYFRGH